jgi:hypothetical protein
MLAQWKTCPSCHIGLWWNCVADLGKYLPLLSQDRVYLFYCHLKLYNFVSFRLVLSTTTGGQC